MLYKNGQLILRDYNNDGESSSITYYTVNTNKKNASLEFISTVSRKKDESSVGISWGFIVEELDANNVKIVEHEKVDGYIVNKELIDNKKSYYKLIDNILLEQKYDNYNSTINYGNEIKWYDLNNNTSGSVNIPYEFVATGYAEVLGNKIIVHALEDTENSLPVDTLVAIDMESNEIDNQIKVGSFMRSLSIDEDTVFLMNDSSPSLDIYDVKNKVRKTLIEYTNSPEKSYSGIHCLGAFNDKDKIYFIVSEDNIMKVKIASISNSNFDEVITVYEKEVDDNSGLSIPQVMFTDDNKEIIVYQSNNDGEITEFNKIKLSK